MTSLQKSTSGAVIRKPSKHRLAGIFSLSMSYLYLILIMLFVLAPIVYILIVSFNDSGSLYVQSIVPEKFSLNNYTKLFTTTNFGKWYLNTVKTGAISALLALIFIIPTAFAFSRMRFRGRKQMLIVTIVLQMFPGTMAMVAYYVLLNMLDLLNTVPGLVLIYVGAAIPGMTWLLKGYLDTIPKALEEAAIIDGANYFQVMMRIILPLAAPMVVLVAVFSFAAPFGDFALSRIIITDPNKYTIALGTYSFVQQEYTKNYGIFAASSILAGLPISIVYLSLQKTIFSGVSGSVVR